ncbi:MAG: alanine racemase [Bacteroidota bacterium]|nr:alanine racemase [Bacteroidota bacterium]
MPLDDITTPTLLLDEAVCRRNIARMQQKAARHAVLFRPHFKTHQSRRVATWFRDAGVTAITVSSVGMARYFADDGWHDITIAFPVNPREAEQIDDLARRMSLGVLIESPDVVGQLDRRLGAAVDAWLKIDTGYGRTGIRDENHALLRETAQAVAASTHLRLRGLLTHGGNTYSAANNAEANARFDTSRRRMLAVADLLRADHTGLRVSVGDTPGCTAAEDFTGIDEIRPGNFVFFDVMQSRRGSCLADDIAIALACPVVALHPERQEVVVHGGAVHLSCERIATPGADSIFGLVAMPRADGWTAPIPGAAVVRLSQEHGIVHLPASRLADLRVGDLLAILPVHSCLTAECARGYRCLDGTTADHFAGRPHHTWRASSQR